MCDSTALSTTISIPVPVVALSAFFPSAALTFVPQDFPAVQSHSDSIPTRNDFRLRSLAEPRGRALIPCPCAPTR